jgi:hypothetical protein
VGGGNSSWNPFGWLTATQNWFSRTERSSGFRPFLIYLFMIFGFCFVLVAFFPQHPVTEGFCLLALVMSVSAFVVLFCVKAFQDPNFCRSEKHIETVRRLELAEQKGDSGPRIVEARSVELIETQEAEALSTELKRDRE